MKKNLWVNFVFIILLTGISAVIVFPGFSFLGKTFGLKLGLDLSGGSRLVFEADMSGVDSSQKEKAINSAKNVVDKRVNFFGISEPNVQTSSFEGKERIIVELPGVDNPQDATSLIGKTAQLVFSEVGEENELKSTDLNGGDLRSADVVFDQNTGKPAISIEFSDTGSKKFEDITARNLNKPLAIVLDEELVSAPTVQEKIIGGKAQISGDFTLDEAKKLEAQLNAGALPVPLKLVHEETIGATLGSESIQKSIKAGFVGIVLVSLFMILNYGLNGMVSVVALFIFAIITLALYKIIPVVLTLPGIAGFLLSVGMAVDSNILIFERLKEEIGERNISDALEVSFGRAWDSIRDANIATLLTAFILANPLNWEFLHVSGPVRGFAITLALGVAVSLFTGIVVSRNLMRLFVRR